MLSCWWDAHTNFSLNTQGTQHGSRKALGQLAQHSCAKYGTACIGQRQNAMACVRSRCDGPQSRASNITLCTFCGSCGGPALPSDQDAGDDHNCECCSIILLQPQEDIAVLSFFELESICCNRIPVDFWGSQGSGSMSQSQVHSIVDRQRECGNVDLRGIVEVPAQVSSLLLYMIGKVADTDGPSQCAK